LFPALETVPPILTTPLEPLYIALPVVVEVFFTVPPVISSPPAVAVSASPRQIVPSAVSVFAEVTIAVPDTVILSDALYTAMPDNAETVPPVMVTVTAY
jgi:hypothetical protein